MGRRFRHQRVLMEKDGGYDSAWTNNERDGNLFLSVTPGTHQVVRTRIRQIRMFNISKHMIPLR